MEKDTKYWLDKYFEQVNMGQCGRFLSDVYQQLLAEREQNKGDVVLENLNILDYCVYKAMQCCDSE